MPRQLPPWIWPPRLRGLITVPDVAHAEEVDQSDVLPVSTSTSTSANPATNE